MSGKNNDDHLIYVRNSFPVFSVQKYSITSKTLVSINQKITFYLY